MLDDLLAEFKQMSEGANKKLQDDKKEAADASQNSDEKQVEKKYKNVIDEVGDLDKATNEKLGSQLSKINKQIQVVNQLRSNLNKEVVEQDPKLVEVPQKFHQDCQEQLAVVRDLLHQLYNAQVTRFDNELKQIL